VCRSKIDGEAKLRSGRQPLVCLEVGKELVEQRLETYRGAGKQVPRNAGRRAVVARRHPADPGIERIEESRLTLASWLGNAHLER